MKTINISQFGAPAKAFDYQEAQDPAPASDEIIIDVAFSGVGGIDAIMRRGDLGAMNPQPPFVPGLEVSGTVKSVGNNVTEFKKGDRVAALLLLQMGGYATVVRCKAINAVHVPDSVPLESACMLVNPVTALMVLRAVAPVDTETILIHGASGGLGTSFGPVAKAVYPKVTTLAVIRNKNKRDEVLQAGFTDVLLTSQFEKQVEDRVHYDAVIDPVGGDIRRDSLKALRPFGRMLLVGNVSGDVDSLVTSQLIWLNALTVRGFNLGLFNTQYPEKVRQTATNILQLIVDGKLQLVPHKIFSLDHVVEAHEYLEGGNVTGQLVLKHEGRI